MSVLLALVLLVLGIPVFVMAGYIGLLTLLSARLPDPEAAGQALRFDVIVPAHNEEPVIARTVASLQKLAWPAAQFRVLVIADNCTDRTAEIARAAGVEVLERTNAVDRGKGFALAMAYAHSIAEGRADACVVVDADTEVSPNILQAFATRLAHGAHAVQSHYGVLNPQASWRTRLMTIALALFHIVRSRGRERLGVSCGLRGNGMCFTHHVLREVPHQAFSLVEDLEYGIALGRAGYRVVYAGEAAVLGEMVSKEEASRSQRARWEGGRFDMMRSQGVLLLQQALRKRSGLLLDLALDVVVPPLAYVGLITFAYFLVTWICVGALHFGAFAHFLAFLSLLVLVLHVLRGWQISGLGGRGALDLARAPGYLLWKIALVATSRNGKEKEWKRTERE